MKEKEEKGHRIFSNWIADLKKPKTIYGDILASIKNQASTHYLQLSVKRDIKNLLDLNPNGREMIIRDFIFDLDEHISKRNGKFNDIESNVFHRVFQQELDGAKKSGIG